MKSIFSFTLVILIATASCANGGKKTKPSGQKETLINISDDSLLTLVQYRTFQYFWDGAEPVSGMARERIHVDGVYPEMI